MVYLNKLIKELKQLIKFKVMLKSGPYYLNEYNFGECEHRIYDLMDLGVLPYQAEFEIIEMGAI